MGSFEESGVGISELPWSEKLAQLRDMVFPQSWKASAFQRELQVLSKNLTREWDQGKTLSPPGAPALLPSDDQPR